MKRCFAGILLLLLLMMQLLPMTVYAEDDQAAALSVEEEPYEKVAAQSGKWYSEQFQHEGTSKLVLQYQGQYTPGAIPGSMDFSLNEKTILRGIYLPFATVSEEPVILQLTDAKGNTFPAFEMKPVSLGETGEKINYVFFPSADIVLEKGSYQLAFAGGGAGAVGAFAVKGVSYEAYERFKETLPPLGNEEFDENNPKQYEQEGTGNSVEKKPAVFYLEQECIIDEIILNTFNGGAGAAPGLVSLIAEDGSVLLTQQAYGGNLGDTANGTWTIAPALLLPAGNYFIGMSDPSVISYDQSGDPLFYVKASEYIPVRYDYTGTYRIDFQAVKTSTIMGPVEGGSVDFALQDFELTVLDKDGYLELIGKYEGMPFSQNCKIVEETENSVTAVFSAGADLTKLPYKAKISGEGTIVLSGTGPDNAQITLEGIGRFQREASAEKGADNNTYALVSSGVMVSSDLPPFVLTALGKSNSVGNIPGPDSPTQAAAGMLFPPLVGLVAGVLQDLMKPKPKAAPVVHDKAWYKKKYPKLSDEQLAMVMLADAMGSTDEPDLEDAEAGSDDQTSSGGDAGYDESDGSDEDETGGFDDDETDSGEETYEDDRDEDDMLSDEAHDQQIEDQNKAASEQEGEQQLEEPEPEEPEPEEPETMVLKTSANGAESLYIKDSKTGEWINAETGGVLDYEKYKNEFVKQMESDKKFNDKQFDKISRGESAHDKALREEMQKIADAEKQEAYTNKLKSKYGTDDLDQIKEAIEKNQERDEASFERWQEIADFNEAGEKTATVAGVVADVGVDALATVVPGGNGIKAGYKVVKSISGTMADKGVNWGSFAEGSIKGAADAGTDYVTTNNPYLKTVTKASITMVGESGGSAAGAYLRGEDWQKAGKEGAVDGVFKVIVSTATDGVAGDYPQVELPKSAASAVGAAKKVLLSKAAAAKTTSGMIDEFGIKPKVANLKKELIK